MLIEARNLAYDANFRNDQAGLRAAIAAMEPLAREPEVEAYAHYYLSWTYWMLVASQIEEKNQPAALESANRALAHARAGLMSRSRDADFQTMLANALVATGILDRERFKEAVGASWRTFGRKPLQLGPDNPRAVIMDAGMIYWAPPEQGGGPDEGHRAVGRSGAAASRRRRRSPASTRWRRAGATRSTTGGRPTCI